MHSKKRESGTIQLSTLPLIMAVVVFMVETIIHIGNFEILTFFAYQLKRGIKATNWEGGIKGIGSIKIPNVKPGMRRQLMHVSDIFPTLASLTRFILF